MKIVISKIPSNGLKELFWNIFFKSKNRGISLERHFPWLENSSSDVIFFEVQISLTTVAGLVLRQRKYQIDGNQITIGMIGLVCVASENRGVGIAAKLLTKAIDYSRKRNYDYLTLWTNQHKIYSKHQFHVADPWLYGWVETNDCNNKLTYEKFTNQKLILENKSFALPPFATSIFEYSLNSFSFTVLTDNDGDIVIDYKGDVINLGLFMIQSLPNRWRLNVVQSDPLISILVSKGADLKLSAVNIQMWLDLKNANPQYSVIKKIIVPVLDRI